MIDTIPTHAESYAKEVEAQARKKLNDIISRFGDDNGARLAPEYLEDIKKEIMASDTVCGATIELYGLRKYGGANIGI